MATSMKVLPKWAHSKWGVKVRAYQIKRGDNKFPPFIEFAYFVTEVAVVEYLSFLTNLGPKEFIRKFRPRINKGKTGPQKINETSTFTTRIKERHASLKDRK